MNLIELISTQNINFLSYYNNLDKYDLVIAICNNKNEWLNLPYGKIIYQRKNSKEFCITQLPNIKGTQIIIHSNIEIEIYIWLKKFSTIINGIDNKYKKIAIITNHSDHITLESCLRTILAYTENMPNFKKNHKLFNTEIDIIGSNYNITLLNKVIAKNKGNAIARYLTLLPTNYLTPSIYIEILSKLAKQQNWSYKLYDKKILKEIGAGAFYSVSRSSKIAGIVKLNYTPTHQEPTKSICLVGKGVCFDTGGINLKNTNNMYNMNYDMMGSAVALGSLLSLSLLNKPYNISCYLAITNNNIDSYSYLPNEVVTALNNKTIEIIDSDAEGRMILSDTLVMASKNKPDLIIDYASLTGSAIDAIGTEYSAIFTNYNNWHNNLVKCGEKSGEKVWPFPMDNYFLDYLDSKIADLKQCSITPECDHIIAAKFLEQFIPKDIRWLHIDLSSGIHKKGLGPIPTELSGMGIWYTCELLENFLF